MIEDPIQPETPEILEPREAGDLREQAPEWEEGVEAEWKCWVIPLNACRPQDQLMREADERVLGKPLARIIGRARMAGDCMRGEFDGAPPPRKLIA